MQMTTLEIPPKRLLTDAERDAIMCIPIVESIVEYSGEVLVRLKKFVSTSVNTDSTIVIAAGATIRIRPLMSIKVKSCWTHPNVFGNEGFPCFGNIDKDIGELLWLEDYASVIAVTCEFLQVFCEDWEDDDERYSCGDCIHDDGAACMHPQWNDSWTYPIRECAYYRGTNPIPTNEEETP